MNDIKCEQVATLQGKFSRMFEQSRRVYGIDGLCPSIHTCGGGNTEIKVGYEEKKVIIYDDFNNRIKADQSVIGTVTPNFGNDAAGNGTKIIVVGNYMPSNHDASRIVDEEGLAPTVKENHGTVTAVAIRGRGENNKQQIEMSNREYANSITTVQKDSMIAERGRNLIKNVAKQLEENKEVIIEDFYKNRDERIYEDVAPTLRSERTGLKVAKCIGGIGEKKSNGGTQYYQQDRIYQGDVALAHPANLPGGSYKYPVTEPSQTFRIRKLTPKECWRLMGQDDEDFAKAESVCSNTQLYKQAGNSIVVNVLEAIFSNLLIK